MDLPVPLPLTPMLAKAIAAVPRSEPGTAGFAYEPKWDGFRCIVLRDGDDLELASRGKKTLTRYFPELREPLLEALPDRCVVDTEIVVATGRPGAQRLDWDALSNRIHPAASRIARLADETPAQVIAFDLVAIGQDSLLDTPLAERRARLEAALAGRTAGSPLHLTRTTRDADEATRWFELFEGAGLDGVIAKPLDGLYTPGRRTMLKIKHKRTAEAVLIGYRVHTSGQGVGSLLLGLYTDDDRLVGVGGISAFTAQRRLELIDELDPLVERDETGAVVAAETDRSRFSSNKDVSYVPLRPERVVEVAFDQLEGQRFRHAVTFLRWRPDREPTSCRLSQIEVAPAYDLGQVLTDA